MWPFKKEEVSKLELTEVNKKCLSGKHRPGTAFPQFDSIYEFMFGGFYISKMRECRDCNCVFIETEAYTSDKISHQKLMKDWKKPNE